MTSTLTKAILLLLNLPHLSQSNIFSPPFEVRKHCVIPAPNNVNTDDSLIIEYVLRDCNRDSVIEFTSGASYNLYSPISATNLTNVALRMPASLHLTQNITRIQAVVMQANRTDFAWIELAGPGIDFIEVSDGTQQWWDQNPKLWSGLPYQPTLLSIKTSNSTLRSLKSRGPIAWSFYIHGENILVENSFVDARSASSKFAFNTGAFDIQGKNITIRNTAIWNGDDAIRVRGDSSDICFDNASISGSSRGMTIGPIGRPGEEEISNVVFRNVSVTDGLYAARLLSWPQGRVKATNITWSNISITNVTFPIFVTQNFGSNVDDRLRGIRTANDQLLVSDIYFRNFTGTINEDKPGDGSCILAASSPCWYFQGYPHLNHTEGIILDCQNKNSCKGFVTSDIKMATGYSGLPATMRCGSVNVDINKGLSLACTDIGGGGAVTNGDNAVGGGNITDVKPERQKNSAPSAKKIDALISTCYTALWRMLGVVVVFAII
ncbi:putative extracellular exo-polygalacturonase [Halenospora varia]|nr:putative extracellular exo-polygalacturonase [Halenospora varia]